MPDDRRVYGFDSPDFRFDERGWVLTGRYAATVPLPEYAVIKIETGQFMIGDGNNWRTEVSLEE